MDALVVVQVFWRVRVWLYMLFAIVFIARSLCFMELDVLVRGGRVGWSEALLLKYSPGWVT